MDPLRGLFLPAILLGSGLWLLSRVLPIVGALGQRWPWLASPRGRPLLAITLVAISFGLMGVSCQLLTTALVNP